MQKESPKKIEEKICKSTIISTVIILMIIRILLTAIPASYKVDISGYKYWSHLLVEKKFSEFYGPLTHCIYGPGYLYILWIAGKISSIFSLLDGAQEFIIKFWSVIFDFIGASILYLIGKNHNKVKLGFWLGILYVLNPAIIMNASVWGQFDTIATVLLLTTIYLLTKNKITLAVTFFTLAVLTKPQSALLTPLVVYMFLREFEWRKLLDSFKQKAVDFKILSGFGIETLKAAIGTILTYTVLVLPFFNSSQTTSGKTSNIIIEFFTFVPKIMLTGGQDYPYATANGFNLWTLLGGQTVNDSLPFLGLSYLAWGSILLFITIITAVYIVIKNKTQLALYYSGFFISFGTFMVWTKMHERYLIPAIIFIMICILWDTRLINLVIIVSSCSFFNQLYVYNMSFSDSYWVARDDRYAMFIALLMLAALAYAIYYIIELTKYRNGKILKSHNDFSAN